VWGKIVEHNVRLLLSCISTNHSLLKQHWNKSRQQTECPLTVLGSYEKPKEDTGGLLCLIDTKEGAQKQVALHMPAGMAPSSRGVFVSSFSSIHEVDADLEGVHLDIVSLPQFNALHSMSRTKQGYLIASTGLDVVLEFNRAGEVLWQWWATDHGFTHTPDGKLRELDKTLDQRTVKYGTLQQTTHVNSAAELPDGRVLASLFHQGTIIVIDRETGNWHTVLEGLDHPHAVRVLDERLFTVADTVHGKALLVELKEGTGRVRAEIDAATNWLQDSQYDQERDCWVLVDGKQSRILLRHGLTGDGASESIAVDPEWRLYEAAVL
jgi:hypothetical protein